ncbi:class I SAM-dependent methyltransferase [Nitriliruptoraceae bacterium ZYF776]|nr:class I SAM-dependent methyltransferase [Profundirhabdus halotolerans]
MTDERVAAIRQLWTDGDYAAVGEGFRAVADHVVDDHVRPGARVLDAATGTGNLAIAAARAGAKVDAFDLTPSLLDEARRRAEAEGLAIGFVEGDLVDVPFPDASFDLVASTFGAFLADDPGRCAAELVRVARPGGRVVATAWAPGSMYVEMTQLAERLGPETIPHGGPSPWADPGQLGALTAELPVSLAVTTHELWLPFASPDDALAFYERTSGPVQRMAGALEDAWPEARAAIVDRWGELAEDRGDHVALPATYTVATLERT